MNKPPEILRTAFPPFIRVKKKSLLSAVCSKLPWEGLAPVNSHGGLEGISLRPSTANRRYHQGKPAHLRGRGLAGCKMWATKVSGVK